MDSNDFILMIDILNLYRCNLYQMKNEEFRVQYEPFVKKDHQELSPLE